MPSRPGLGVAPVVPLGEVVPVVVPPGAPVELAPPPTPDVPVPDPLDGPAAAPGTSLEQAATHSEPAMIHARGPSQLPGCASGRARRCRTIAPTLLFGVETIEEIRGAQAEIGVGKCTPGTLCLAAGTLQFARIVCLAGGPGRWIAVADLAHASPSPASAGAQLIIG